MESVHDAIPAHLIIDLSQVKEYSGGWAASLMRGSIALHYRRKVLASTLSYLIGDNSFMLKTSNGKVF